METIQPTHGILYAEDPILLSGTLRSTLDIFGEYDDAEIVRVLLCFMDSEYLPHVVRKYEALRRVNLLKSFRNGQSQFAMIPAENASIFANLDTPVSELGDNFSTG